ncbi:hypothetical protein DM860_011849 [Cuscuta australis]|uniref:Dual specificity protein phosphatase 1 n=1 Tax=Cuscuta australis TaxID=267555 RepID=A0A328D9A3_9ASTE|nr:hypothetical protein DM860_011849 [Cuscuta australis]
MDPAMERHEALLPVMQKIAYLKRDGIPCKIEEGLYLGSVGAAMNRSTLKSLNITHVLMVANSLSPPYPSDFVYKVISVSDRADADISQNFEECFQFIDEAKRSGGVLVHCFMGRSRSVTIVLAYLMKKNGISLAQALEHVRSQRRGVEPNAGFFSQLKNLEKTLQVGRME